VRRVTAKVEELTEVTDEVVEAFGRLLPQLSRSARPQFGSNRGVAPKLAVQGENLDEAAAPRHLQIDAAHRFTVEACYRAELQVDIDVDILGLALAVVLPVSASALSC